MFLLGVADVLSILAWEQNACRRTVGLGDDPDLRAAFEVISREDSTAVHESILIGLLVFVAQIAPVAGYMATEELIWRLPGAVKDFQSTGSGNDLSELKLGGSHQRLPVWFV